MALGFLKKVFSFGKKEVVVEPAADEPLAPLNFDALEGLKREADHTAPAAEEVAPVDTSEASRADAEPEPAPRPQPTPAPERPSPAPTPEVEPEPAPVIPTPAPETSPPSPAPEIQPEPAPPAPQPAPPEVPPTEPERPVEIPREPARPQPIPETPKPSVPPEIEPEPAPPAPQPRPQEVPVPERPVEIPQGPSTPAEPAPGPVEIPPTSSRDAPAPSSTAGAEGRARPATRPEPDAGGPDEVTGSSNAPTIDVAEEASSTAEMTPSAPPAAEHLPLEGGEEAVPVAAPHLPSGAGQSRATGLDPSFGLPQAGKREQAGKVIVAKKVEQKAESLPVAPSPAPRVSWFQRLREGLSRSSRELTGNVAGLFTKRRLDEDTLQDLEDVLIRADLGVETALRITDALSAGRYGKNVSDEEVRTVMAEEIGKVLTPVAQALELDLSHKPHVILVVGVNGTGKTTTIGKLAAKLTQGGLSVMLAAGDTFRAAAIEQLKIWGERTRSPVIASKLGADAAGLAYDAFEKAKEAGSDVLIIDTAGRLQNKTELMAELEKIVRVLGKLDPEAPHTVLQTVDATTGQNALNQVEIFRNVAGVNGLVMTKLDGTARGGILVGIAAKYKLPVYFIGVGEQVDDLEPFSASDFAKAIAGIS
jgi:fused signal recognition particle receptor